VLRVICSANPLATSRGRASMARIAGVDLPREEVEVRADLRLGISSTAKKILGRRASPNEVRTWPRRSRADKGST